MSWDWDHLRYFLALADSRTLVAAARELNVSHTTVLRRVKAFESQLETRLFEHTGQGYELNEQGESLYAEAVKMRQAIDAVSSQIAGADKQPKGEVVITTTDTLAHEVLPDMLKKIVEKHEGLRFSLQMINQISDIDKHEADIAVRTCLEPPEQLIGRRVGSVKFVACASAEYVRQQRLNAFPKSTNDYRFIFLDDSYSESPFHSWLENRVSKTAYRTTASNFLSAAALCRSHLGITVLPEYLLNNQKQLIELATDEPISGNDLWVLSHADSRDTERVRLTRKLLHELLSEFFNSE